MKDVYIINTDQEVLILPYFALNRGKPFIEYIHGNSTGRYIVNERGNLIYFSSIADGDEDVSIKPEYRKLVDAEIVSCPRDIDGRMEMAAS